MKRSILVVALTALFVGMVPAASIGAQVDAQALAARVHIINPSGGVPFDADIWSSSDGGANFTKSANVAGAPGVDASSQDYELAAPGTYVTRLCLAGLPAVCNEGPGAPPGSSPIPDWTIGVAGDSDNTVVIGVGQFVNDNSATDFGYGRVTINNVPGIPLSYKVGSTGTCKEIVTAGSPPQGAVEIPATQDALFYLGAPNCVGPTPAPLPVAAGVNLVYTLACAPTGTQTPCTETLLVGQNAGESASNVPAFCTVLNPDLGALQAELKTVLNGTGKDDPATLLALANKINALVAAGDASVPVVVADPWARTSSDLLKLASTFQLVKGKWSAIPAADQQTILDGINDVTPQTAQEKADRDALTAWYLGNCIATATVTFTG